MDRRPTAWIMLALLAVAAPSYGLNILSNGSFESNLTSWTKDPSYSISAVTSYSGVTPLSGNGNKFMVVSGPGTVGYTYAPIVSQSKSAPFGGDVPVDKFVVYLSGYTYLHTNPGHTVSYALTIEPGYGLMSSAFYGGATDEWGIAQASGYYYAHDPFNSSSAVKPLKVTLELRDSLQLGEYLLLDNVELWYSVKEPGTPEPSGLLALAVGMIGSISVFARRRRL